MATRTIEATLDTFSVDAGSEITYLGPTAAGNKGDAVRGFRVNPGGTGDIKVTLDRSEGVNTIQIFQEDAFGTGTAVGVAMIQDIVYESQIIHISNKNPVGQMVLETLNGIRTGKIPDDFNWMCSVEV